MVHVLTAVLFSNLRRCTEDLWALNTLIGEAAFLRSYTKTFPLVEPTVTVTPSDLTSIEVRGDSTVILFTCL